MPRKSTKKDYKKSSSAYIFAVGRRKTAVARVRLYSGKGENVVNEKPFSSYFPSQANEIAYSLPLSVVKSEGKYWISAKIAGGGKEGQLDALVHGISRALVLAKEEFRPLLKKYGLLTRDSRTRERRKVGTGGKSRRKKQSPKR